MDTRREGQMRHLGSSKKCSLLLETLVSSFALCESLCEVEIVNL